MTNNEQERQKMPEKMDSLDLSDIVQGSLYLRLAKGTDDILLSQRLRYNVFFEELHADASEEVKKARRDIDGYDEISDHLLVFDSSIEDDEYGQLVGTYRLLRQSQLSENQKFYTEDEYDIRKIKTSFNNILELGRSCVRNEYRTKQVINLLWHGLSRYIAYYDIDVMLGCASFHGADVAKHKAALLLLHHYHLAPENICPISLSQDALQIKPFDEKQYSLRGTMRHIPPLIKGYIRVGSYIGQGIFIDDKFDTVDVCVVLPIESISPRYFNHFLRDVKAE